MSRHRDSVLSALTELRRHATRGANVDFVAAMWSAGLSAIAFDLLADITLTPVLGGYVAEIREVLAAHHVDEIEEAEIIVTARLSSREATCVVQGNAVARRNMHVADVTIRPRIRTRFVNIWLDSEKRIEWLRTAS